MSPYEKAKQRREQQEQSLTCLINHICPDCGENLHFGWVTQHKFLRWEWKTTSYGGDLLSKFTCSGCNKKYCF